MPFAFGGRLALDLTWTLRYRAVEPTELLRAPDDLERWLACASVGSTRCSDTDLVDALALREAIHRVAVAHIDGGRPSRRDVRLLNDLASRPVPPPTLAAGADGLVAEPLDARAAVASVARDAVLLFGGGDRARLRRCAGPGCALLFYDSSRPGTRRWCDVARCGNRVNLAASRRRHARTPTPGGVA